MTRFFNKALISVLVPAAMLVMACRPQDVVNPVTPPTPEPEPEQGSGGNGQAPEGGSGTTMTVCTFNIRYANTADKYPDGSSAAWTVRAPSVKKFIDTTQPDLIGLQEIRKEQSTWFSSTFAKDYGYYDVSRDSSSGSTVATAGGEGVGFMYRKDRFELVTKDFFWLDTNTRSIPAKNSDETYGDWHSACRRVTVYGFLKDKKNNGAMVYFFPTHYDHKSDDARKKSAELMLSQMKTLCKVTDLKEAGVVIVHVGDLNTTSDNAALKPLNDNMFYARNSADSSEKNRSTFNGFGDSSKIIDHIYYGGKTVKPLKYWVDTSDYGVPFLSDHYPVLFQFEY